MKTPGFLLLIMGGGLLATPHTLAQTNQPAVPMARVTNQTTARSLRPLDPGPLAPAVLPGKGLAEHDFMYAGENGGHQNIYIIRKGKVDWSYTHPAPRGEISDAIFMSNGDILFAHQFGVSEVSPDKKVVWNYDAPPGTEIHTAQPIGKDHVVLIENGNPARLLVVNKTTGATVKSFELPVRNTNSIHAQFRHARLTEAGTILVAHLDLGKVCEYDADGKVVWSLDLPNPWVAEPLANGHILVTRESSYVREITRQGGTVWEFLRADLPDIKRPDMQTATRLANGDTLINNWCSKGNGTAVQAFEVSPDKKLVWALRSWADPDLGPSTTLQVLDEPSTLDSRHFGDIR